MYRVVKTFATANRRFLAGAEVHASDLPDYLDAQRLVASGHIEAVSQDGQADDVVEAPTNPPPFETLNDDAVA